MGDIRIMVDNKIVFGIIGLIIMTGGGIILLSPEQLNSASTCTTNNITGIFESFSSTNVTAYWTVNGTKKSSVCSKGKWIPTTEWLKQNNLSAENITIQPIQESIITEEGIEIIDITKPIIINQSKQISISGKIYNVTYTEKAPMIKCICDKTTGCKIKECLG
jgi:hypothetical protein